jgi:4-hydroxy-2-oxoheptanedioate aldolase
MNLLELQMVDILKELKEKHGAISVRAEFEAEGNRMEELLRLKEISMAGGLGLTLKIGGCESIRDMLESRVIGVDYLVAPMIESGYALRKYLQAVDKVFSLEERESVEFLCNIETKAAIDAFDEILKIPEIRLLDGIVIERVDLCFSLGLREIDINDKSINALVRDTLQKAKAQGLTCTVGGGVGAHSLPFFRSLSDGLIGRFETRKVCFDCSQGVRNASEKGILKALGFEVLWLKNKLKFYRSLSVLDGQRIDWIEERYRKEIDELI